MKLSEINLSQWVGFYNKYGKDLELRTKSLTDDTQLQWEVDNALCHYMWYNNVELSAITKETVGDILKKQFEVFAEQLKEENELDYTNVFVFDTGILRSEVKIQPVITNTGKLTREEFEISQDIALIFSDLQDGRTEAIYELCAAFLRAPDEPYRSGLLTERVEIMKQLPLSIALCVKHYVEDTISLYLQSINVES